jgi:phosphatidylglycerophosphate synthase
VDSTPGAITAVLLATVPDERGGAAAALPAGDGTILTRLLEQLAALGVGSVHVITRPGWEPALPPATDALELHTSASVADDLRTIGALAIGGEGDMLIASADVVAHGEAIAAVLVDSRFATGALCAAGALPGALAPAEREPHGRLVSAGSSYHAVSRPNVAFLGIVKAASANRHALADVVDRLAALPTSPAESAVSLLLVGLVRSGVRAGVVPLRNMFWARPASHTEAEAANREIGALDEDRLLLDSAVKANDSFFTTYLVSPYSKYLARWAARRGLTPNQITTASLAIGVLAALAFATGDRAGLIAGAILLQISFVTDCVDGQLARYTRNFSRLGAWLDAVFDRTKEYAIYAGLAIGASAAGDPVWVLAGAALAVQTVRHAIDFSYLTLEQEELAAARRPPLDQATDRSPDAAGNRDSGNRKAGTQRGARGPAATWDSLTRRGGAHWAKQFIAFPIGERFAAISITAALASARAAFVVLLAWGGIATAYKMLGRLVRTLAR